MGLPTLNINFITAAVRTAARINRGTVAVVVKDEATTLQKKLFKLSSEADIPSGLSDANKAYVKTALIGGENKPKNVLLAVIPDGSEDYEAAFELLATQQWDWLAAAPDCSATDAQEIAEWITERRKEGAIYKAVLPNHAANSEAIVNFAASGIITTAEAVKANGKSLTAAEYAARIAGFICGTPLRSSITYGILPEVSDITRLSKAEMNAAIDAGKLILMHDGVKVKIARGVTSLTTVGTDKFPQMQKIKIMDAIDTINRDLRLLVQDEYIGKKVNSYDNKCLLMTAIGAYFKQLEHEGVLAGGSVVNIDNEAQRAYLAANGIDVTDMTDDEIRQANTGTHVFISAAISVYDAIEDVEINISLDLGA
ncbi:MAG: phage tail sheath protein [Christensenellaceae bacterium]|nr:phage tail sheath protein [Christensenellaceae bacterium]